MVSTSRVFSQNALWLALLALSFPVVTLAQSTALTGIAHAAFRVSDVDKSRAFYRALGVEQAFEFGDAGKTSVSYIKINDRQFVELYQRKDDAQPLGLLHVCFESDDLNALHDEYVRRGLSPSPVKKAHAGNLLSVFHDPEGELLEYTQYLPGSLHSQQKGKLLDARRIADRILRVTELAQDVQAERNFYVSKLGFTAQPDGEAVLLGLPGSSGEEIEVVPSAGRKPGITFAAGSIAQTEEELHRRGIAVQATNDDVLTADPDGNVVRFVARSASTKQ